MDGLSKYRFLLDSERVYPIIGDEFSYEWEKVDDSFFFRKKLKDDVELQDVDFDTVNDEIIDHKFEFIIEKNIDDVWTEDYKGYFYKTDCKYDLDQKTLTVKPKPDDGYDDFKRVLNNQYNLVDLNPTVTPITYLLRPVLQIMIIQVDAWGGSPSSPTVFRGNDRITNVMGAISWEEELDSPMDLGDRENYDFEINAYTPGDEMIFFWRVLTTLDIYNGETTEDRLINDLSKIPSYYNKIAKPDIEAQIETVTYLQDDPSKYGLAVDCTSPLNKYYRDRQENYSDRISVPLSRPTWKCESAWYNASWASNLIELANSEERMISDAYKLSDVIQLLLEQETNILHQESIDYSEFLYDTVDPIAGDKYYPIITPKSNVINAYYSQPATKTNIRLSEILQMYASAFRLYWHIETVGTEQRLRLEHISWYENGGSYGSQVVDFDLTMAFDKRNGLPFSYDQNKYSFDKSKMPQRYEFAWQDDVADYFNGEAIEIITNEIEQGDIKKEDSKLFTPDITSLPARSESALDGFVIFDGELDGGDYNVSIVDLEILPGINFRIQNGYMSYQELHPKYHRYGLPSENIRINGIDTTALSITRTKQQEVEFTSENIEIDPLHLIRTDLGEGQVEKMTQNIVEDSFKITINHDTE